MSVVVCKGIEIETSVYSGCRDMVCWMCHGWGVVNCWRAECPRCLGCGFLNDCPSCKPAKSRDVRSARFTNYGNDKPFMCYADGEF